MVSKKSDLALIAHLLRRAGFVLPIRRWNGAPVKGMRPRLRSYCTLSNNPIWSSILLCGFALDGPTGHPFRAIRNIGFTG